MSAGLHAVRVRALHAVSTSEVGRGWRKDHSPFVRSKRHPFRVLVDLHGKLGVALLVTEHGKDNVLFATS